MDTRKNLTGGQINRFAMCSFTISMANMLQMTYITIFMTDYIGIPTAMVAATLLAARLIDFIFSLFSGMIIEKARLPWGKYRSWLLILRWILCFSIICIFLDTSDFPIPARIAVSLIGYCFFNVSHGLQQSAYNALSPLLAKDNMSDRVRLTSRQLQFSCFTNILFAIITLPIINVLKPHTGAANAFMIVAIIYVVPYLFGAQAVSNLCKECDPGGVKREAGQVMSVKEMLLSIFRNKQLLVLFVVFSCNAISNNIITNVKTYFYTYITGSLNNMTYSQTVSMIAGFVASLILPAVGKRLGKKRAMLIGLTINTVTLFFNRFVGSSWVKFAILTSIGISSTYLFVTVGANYFIDAGEYHYWKTGKDSRLMSVAVQNVSTKVGLIVGGVIATFGLSVIGYSAGMEVTESFKSGFMNMISFIPFAIGLVALIVMAVGYRISDSDAARYARENQEKAEKKLQSEKIS